jgi:RNA polymerase sigma-70 factor (ECF subfamily)
VYPNDKPTHAANPSVRQLLEGIYRNHRQGLFTLALSLLHDAPAAEDAVHEAFARLCRMDHPPSGDATAYVFAAVRNAAMDQRRQSARPGRQADSIFDKSLAAPADSPSRAMEQAELDRLIRRALSELGEESRQVVVMKIYGGLTFDQIAQASGEPLSTVSSRYQRALQKMKSSMESLV